MANNSEVIRSLYQAFAKGDVPAVLGAFHSNISWTEAEGFPYGGTYIGPDAVLNNVFIKLGTEWDGYAVVPREFIAEGDIVMAIGDYSGTYKATGKSMSAPFVHAWNLQDGKVIRFRQFTDTAVIQKALKADYFMTPKIRAQRAVLIAAGSIVFTLSVWVWILSRPEGTFHDQGGLAITLIYFPATFSVWLICSLLSVVLGRCNLDGLPETDVSRVKTLRLIKAGLVALGFFLSIRTLFIA